LQRARDMVLGDNFLEPLRTVLSGKNEIAHRLALYAKTIAVEISFSGTRQRGAPLLWTRVTGDTGDSDFVDNAIEVEISEIP
jgi:hypothetical protein